MGRPHLLLITIGPVQGFIATARRTRDLYAGSRLLSEAAGEITQLLLNEGVDLIFPAVKTKKELDSLREAGIPNIIMGLVPDAEPQRIRELAEKAREEATSFLQETAEEIFDRTRTRSVLKNRDAAFQQVKDRLEFYWTAAPVQDDYAATRDRVNRLMAARKNTRDFSPATWSGPVPKSSLSGDLESVTYGASSADKHKAGLREGEELSGVDLLKRRFLSKDNKRQITFASTTHMALLPFLQGLSKAELNELLNVIDGLQKRLDANYDGWPPDHLVNTYEFLKTIDPRIFFPSRHPELASEANLSDEDVWKSTQEKLIAHYKKLKREPYPYYAILLADGDHMGKIIDQLKTAGEHKAISSRLTEFSQKVKKIVEKEHQGSLIYSGGDDVLALLPLHTALQCAQKLSDTFKERLNTENRHSPTLSVGLAVVHHLFDLGEALNLARKAEKEAKKTRNALAVIFSPRSGAETTASGEWCENPPINQRIEDLARWQNQGAIPHGFAYELREISEILSDIPNGEKLLTAEAIRILKRKATSPSEDQSEDRVAQTLDAWINERGADRLSRELIVARPFAQALELATSREKEDAR